jgi:hypothetical protein
MKIPGGPLAYQSRHQPAPLTEDEEAALVFAACGITGHSLANLCYSPDGGGNIMAGLVARTIASGDGLQTVALIVTNDEATYLIRRPRELPAAEIPEVIELGRQGAFTQLYRRLRVMMGKLLSTNDAPSGQLPFTDGALVTANMFQPVFPYINPPLAGSPKGLSVTITLQSSQNVKGPYADIASQYNSSDSTLSTSSSGSSTGFYRTSGDQSGVVLGPPAVTGSNVVMGVQVP